MDIVSEFLKSLLPHWPFVIVSFTIGIAGQVFKATVWTAQRAAANRLFWWIRAFLPLHGPFVGALVGVLGWCVFKDGFPASPGIKGASSLILYYMGAGACSSLVFHAVQHFAQSRGLFVGIDDEKTPTESPSAIRDRETNK